MLRNANMLKLRPEASGLSLVEIMLAFLILCTAAFGAAGVISFGHRGTVADFRQGEALQILVDRMNKLSSMPFATLDSFLVAAGSNEATINSNIEDIVFGDAVVIEKNTYRIRAVLKRQTVAFRSLMELAFPNPDYRPASPSTWLFQNRAAEVFNGVANPYVVIKITVMVKPMGGLTDEREVQAITFVADMET